MPHAPERHRLHTAASRPSGWALWLLPVLALMPVLPLLLHGPSCGHDFGFHLQSWIDAGDQLRHGHLLPRWASSPAFNAGEPRFVFYPPLSWLLGAVLMLALPAPVVVAAYTWLALAGAAAAMYRLASGYTGRSAALLASATYLANPYLLFTAYERTAFAELLAAAWMPLLLRAALAPAPSPLGIAVPLALLWLTNAPAAVMGTYAFVALVLLRAVFTWWRHGTTEMPATVVDLLRDAAIGLALGLMLPAFYLVPAAWERRYVQIAMAIIPNMRVEDNFLFGHTGYGPHDQVLHTASLVALIVCGTLAIALALGRLTLRPQISEAKASTAALAELWTCLAVLAIAGFAMLWHPALFAWHLLPELAFLQFPWRFLAVLGCLLGFAVGLALRRVRLRAPATFALALMIVAAASALAIRPFRQGCEANEQPADRVTLFLTHHGVAPTDEYTPTPADNDQLRWDDPAFWLASDPNAPGPGTVPNPAATILDYDQPPPLALTVSGGSPRHLELHLAAPQDLILNLRDYPAWQVTLNGDLHPAHLQRDDGLLALALPAGQNTVDIRWRTLPDVWVGDALTALALAAAAGLSRRSRRIRN